MNPAGNTVCDGPSFQRSIASSRRVGKPVPRGMRGRESLRSKAPIATASGWSRARTASAFGSTAAPATT